MKTAFAFVCLPCLAASELDPERLAAEINARETTWYAAPPSLGSTRSYGAILEDVGLPMSTMHLADEDIPDSFDAREAWPQCASIIGRIRDQSKCGSCWAFGSTEAFNDRHCIATGDTQTVFSPWDTTSCAPGNGCSGGIPANAWKWFQDVGVVSGGDSEDVGSGATCDPYQFATCWHHLKSDTYPKCPDMDYPTPSCASECSEAGYPVPYAKDKHRAASAYMISGEKQMQAEIMTYGPITVGFDVYSNWEYYLGGVYSGDGASSFVGGHAVKVIGWGVCVGEQCKDSYICRAISGSVTDSWCVQNCLVGFTKYCPATMCECDQEKLAGSESVPYWLVANSWNKDFGESGFFRIKRGGNVCNFEGAHVSAGHVDGQSVVV